MNSGSAVDKGSLARVRSALAGASALHETSAALRASWTDQEPDPAEPFIWAFDYHYLESSQRLARGASGPWGPMLEMDGRIWPPPLPTVADEHLAAWADAAAALSDLPLGAARLHDLLWERRWGERPDLHARSAVDAYTALIPESESLDSAHHIARSMELAIAVGDREREREVVALSLAAARRSLEASTPEPGVALRHAEALLTLPRERQPAEVDELLEGAASIYADDPWIVETVLDLKVERSTDPDAVRALRLQQVNTWRAAASEAAGLVKLSHLQRALELARLHNLGFLIDEVRLELQAISEEDLDLKELSAEVTVPADEVERYIERLVGGSWQEALTAIGAVGPPSGQVEKNIADIEQQMKDFPLSHLFTRTLLGPDGIPTKSAMSEEEHKAEALIRQELFGIQVESHFRAEALDRARERYGQPSAEELAEFFTTPLITAEIAERFARSLDLYWSGHFDEAALVALPRIEAVLRNVAREGGFAIVREPQPTKPGGVKPLGEILRLLEGGYPESWRRYLLNALVEPTGFNLRNVHLHGVRAAATREEAAILIQIACHLRLIRSGPSDDETSPHHPAPA